MKDELFTDRQLADALATVQDRHMDSLPCAPEPHAFSEEFESKMHALFREERRRAALRKVLRTATAALLALVLGLTLFFTFNTEARASTLAWIKREFGQYSIFDFLHEPSGELPDCRLTWIPEKMECVVDETVISRTLVFIDPEVPERGFTFMYMHMGEESDLMVIGLDMYEFCELQINGNYAEFYISTEPDTSHMLTWLDEDAGIAFAITAALDVDEILRIAEGVVLSE